MRTPNSFYYHLVSKTFASAKFETTTKIIANKTFLILNSNEKQKISKKKKKDLNTNVI